MSGAKQLRAAVENMQSGMWREAGAILKTLEADLAVSACIRDDACEVAVLSPGGGSSEHRIVYGPSAPWSCPMECVASMCLHIGGFVVSLEVRWSSPSAATAHEKLRQVAESCPRLTTLAVRGSSITRLPPELGKLPLEAADVDPTHISWPAPEACKLGPGSTATFLKQAAKGKPCSWFKLVMVGGGFEGKTSVLRALKRSRLAEAWPEAGLPPIGVDSRTEGIDMGQWLIPPASHAVRGACDMLEPLFKHREESKGTDEKPHWLDSVRDATSVIAARGVKFVVYDMSGQEVYHMTHTHFLSSRSVYVQVVDLSRWSHEKGSVDDYRRVLQWVSKVFSQRAGRGWVNRIVLIGSHVDEVDGGVEEAQSRMDALVRLVNEWTASVSARISASLATLRSSPHSSLEEAARLQGLLVELRENPVKAVAVMDSLSGKAAARLNDGNWSSVAEGAAGMTLVTQHIISVLGRHMSPVVHQPFPKSTLSVLKKAIPSQGSGRGDGSKVPTLREELKLGYVEHVSVLVDRLVKKGLCKDAVMAKVAAAHLHDFGLAVRVDDTVFLEPEWLAAKMARVINQPPAALDFSPLPSTSVLANLSRLVYDPPVEVVVSVRLRDLTSPEWSVNVTESALLEAMTADGSGLYPKLLPLLQVTAEHAGSDIIVNGVQWRPPTLSDVCQRFYETGFIEEDRLSELLALRGAGGRWVAPTLGALEGLDIMRRHRQGGKTWLHVPSITAAMWPGRDLSGLEAEGVPRDHWLTPDDVSVQASTTCIRRRITFATSLVPDGLLYRMMVKLGTSPFCTLLLPSPGQPTDNFMVLSGAVTGHPDVSERVVVVARGGVAIRHVDVLGCYCDADGRQVAHWDIGIPSGCLWELVRQVLDVAVGLCREFWPVSCPQHMCVGADGEEQGLHKAQRIARSRGSACPARDEVERHDTAPGDVHWCCLMLYDERGV